MPNGPVKTENERKLLPADLRAYAARHDMNLTEIARQRGVSKKAVSAALRADLTARPVSQRLLHDLLDTMNSILLQRNILSDEDSPHCLP